jgi:hypothetical protein
LSEGAPPQPEDCPLPGANRSNHRRRQSVAEETTPHGQADLRTHPGDGVRGKVYPGERCDEGAFASGARGLHAR